MALAIQIVLAAAYALFAHSASSTGNAPHALAALLALVLMLLVGALAARRAWAWIALPLLVGGCWLLYRAGLAGLPLLLVPVAFVAAIAWLFARSLWSPHGPLITRIVAGLEGVPWQSVAPDLRRYTRRLTAAWAWVLLAMGACNLVLALVASPGGLLESIGVVPPFTITRTQWSWFANLLNYGVVGGFFVGEYLMRSRWFPARYTGFVDFLRQLVALGPAFWKDFLR